MKILICGGGKITRHLLARLSETWQITLVEIADYKIEKIEGTFPDIKRVVGGDASSPVVLDELGISTFDYVLALTNNDLVNKAIINHARINGVSHLLTIVNEQENIADYDNTNVRTVVGKKVCSLLEIEFDCCRRYNRFE